jgi:hypothetical protein
MKGGVGAARERVSEREDFILVYIRERERSSYYFTSVVLSLV